MNWQDLTITVAGGVSVAAVLAITKVLWRNSGVPTGLSKTVSRRGYLAMILALSSSERVTRLDAVVPNLLPAGDSPRIKAIQDAWTTINERRGVRVITRENQQALAAGAQLLSRGIDVRVARELNTGHISYHIFDGAMPQVVLNQRATAYDRPEKIEGASLAKIFKSSFDQLWGTSVPLESLLAEEGLGGLTASDGRLRLLERVNELSAKYRLDSVAAAAVLRHMAFRHDAPVIFITGLPGAGKSVVRHHLELKLSQLRFRVDGQSDYVFAYVDYLHALMRLRGDRGAGFSAEPNGAFLVDSEDRLQPALQALANRAWQNRHGDAITLVEFARSDVVAALAVFGDEILAASHVIYVRASNGVREARLTARAQPPRVHVAEKSIVLLVSDDHQLPSVASESLYAADNTDLLKDESLLKGRIHVIDNDYNDPVGAGLDASLDQFIEKVLAPYRTKIGDERMQNAVAAPYVVV